MNRLKFLRNNKGEFLKDTAKNLNIPFQTLSSYENETRDMSTEILRKLSNYYGVTIDYLLGVDNKEKNEMARKSEFKVKLGNRIKNLRENNNYTQMELANKLGVTNTTLSNYETGYNEPDGETLVKLAKILNVSTDYLLGYTSNENPIEQLNLKLSKLHLTKEEFEIACKSIREYYSGDTGIIKPIDLQKLNNKEKLAFMEFQTVMADYFNKKLGEELGDDFELFPSHKPNEKEKTKLKITQIYVQDKINDIISQLDKERIINENS